MALGAFFMYGVYRLLSRWLDFRHRGAGGLTAGELDELRRQLSELGDLPARVLELEERLDFAERLLARREQPLLGGE
jgi:hypothetical protein